MSVGGPGSYDHLRHRQATTTRSVEAPSYTGLPDATLYVQSCVRTTQPLTSTFGSGLRLLLRTIQGILSPAPGCDSCYVLFKGFSPRPVGVLDHSPGSFSVGPVEPSFCPETPHERSPPPFEEYGTGTEVNGGPSRPRL